MQPRWLNGDLVAKEPMSGGKYHRHGMIVGVTKSNAADNHLKDIYPYVYYVFFLDGKFEGPLWQSQLHDA